MANSNSAQAARRKVHLWIALGGTKRTAKMNSCPLCHIFLLAALPNLSGPFSVDP